VLAVQLMRNSFLVFLVWWFLVAADTRFCGVRLCVLLCSAFFLMLCCSALVLLCILLDAVMHHSPCSAASLTHPAADAKPAMMNQYGLWRSLTPVTATMSASYISDSASQPVVLSSASLRTPCSPRFQ
jgi:hypothetical protein